MKFKIHNSKYKILIRNFRFWFWIFIFTSFILNFKFLSFAKEPAVKATGIEVNGDRVEYSADTHDVVATGNVEVIHGGSKLTCQKLTVNTLTKDGVAEGNARLESDKGIIEGDKLTYNFEKKSGLILDSQFRANPYFGKAERVEKVNDSEFIAYKGYATTCDFDKPHYRIQSKEISIFPQNKIETEKTAFFVGPIPLFYIPRYNHSLTQPYMHVELMPGSRKDWGGYILSTWRYNLTENVSARAYLDYRSKLGTAEGFSTNYKTPDFGTGNFKFYYTDEKSKGVSEGSPKDYQRYLLRFRHKWDIDSSTNFITEMYKISDQKRKFEDPNTNFLKDYFYREYEKDTEPLSYALFHHNFNYSMFDFYMQKCTNLWYNQLDSMPEVRYTRPSFRLGQTPFYFENLSTFASMNKTAATVPVSPEEVNSNRLDSTNKFSLPKKIAFLNIAPFVSSRQTFYDKGENDIKHPMRTIFSSGIDVSTKLLRIYNVKYDFFGINIDGLRHVITPTILYTYNHTPTIKSADLKQIDDVDALTSSNSATLQLDTKLQTKRNGVGVDLADLWVTTAYNFNPQYVQGDKMASNISDIYTKLQVSPFNWMSIYADATYKHSGTPADLDWDNYNHISDANFGLNFNFDKKQEKTFDIGQRYERMEGNELTCSFKWRLNPKWKFSVYERYNIKRYCDTTGQDVNPGSLEQEFVITRNMHCWDIDFTYNDTRNQGSSIWVIFRLKAFPKMEFGFNQKYNKPQSGSQQNP